MKGAYWPKPEQVTLAEWLERAKQRFGPIPDRWTFQCPACGHIQTCADFKSRGLDPQSAYQECLGRHLPERSRNLASEPSAGGTKSPCDYAAYGLFRSGIDVLTPEGSKVPVFPFAPEAKPEAAA